MMGIKITVPTNMINNVSWLDELSQTMRLCSGFDEDGNMKGNMLTPTVAMMPITDSALITNATRANRASIIANNADNIPNTGTNCIKGMAL